MVRARNSKSLRQRFAALFERLRRHWVRVAFVTVVALLAYPVLGTLALSSGFVEWLLRSEDLKVVIENPSYTLWPGHVRLHHVGIYVNGDTQFTLEGTNLVTTIRLLPLLRHRIHVTELRAQDVRYRMRVQVESTRGIEKRLAAYPPLPEIPGAKTVREKAARKTEKRERDYTVQVDGIDVNVSELWFLEYRYLGHGTLKGGFLVGPNVMRVVTSVQNLGPGDLRFGPDQVIASNFRGNITAEIPQVNPNEHADTSFLDFVTARIILYGDVQSMRHVGAYLHGMDVSYGKGSFEADVSLAKGWLGPGSSLHYTTDRVALLGKGFGVTSDLDLKIDTPREQKREVPDRSFEPGDADRPRIATRAKATYVSFAGRGHRTATLRLSNHHQQAVLKSRQIGSLMALRRARLNFPHVTSSDLGDIDAVLPEQSPVHLNRGTARASLALDVDENYVARGILRLAFDGARLKVADIDLGGDGLAEALPRFDIKHRWMVLKDFNLSLADVLMHVGDAEVKHWWMNLSSERITAQANAQRYEASFSLRAKDAKPVLEALAEKNEISSLIPKFTSLSDLKIVGTVRKKGPVTDVTLDPLESHVFDVAGRFYTNGKQSRSALVVGGKVISVGIAKDDEHTEIRPFAHSDWLNDRLRTFPRPLEQVRPPAP